MFCIKCGKEIENNVEYCIYCGKSLKVMHEEIISKSGWNGLLIALFVILAIVMPIIGFIIGIVGVTQKRNQTTGAILMVISVLAFLLGIVALTWQP